MFVVFTVVCGVNSSKVGLIHMHGVSEGYFEHNNFKKFVERNTGIPVHLLDVSMGALIPRTLLLFLVHGRIRKRSVGRYSECTTDF
jgi:hypothetical protein